MISVTPWATLAHASSFPNYLWVLHWAILNWVSKLIRDCFGCFTSLSHWSRKLTPLTRPIRCKTKTNGDLVARVFPPLRQFTCFDFAFLLTVKGTLLSSDWLLWFLYFWFHDNQSRSALSRWTKLIKRYFSQPLPAITIKSRFSWTNWISAASSKDTYVYLLDSYFVQSRFPEGLVAEYSGGKQAHVRYPQILEADSGDS